MTAPPAKGRSAAVNAPPRPAPSNAPTIFLLLLVIGAFVFVGWWAFWGQAARPEANAVLAAPTPVSMPSAAPVSPAPASDTDR